VEQLWTFFLEDKKDSFQALIEAIIYQQLHFFTSIYNRFLAYSRNRIPTPEQIISSSDLGLRIQVGLSRMKITYLKDLATQIVDCRLNLIDLPGMQDEEVISQLTRVKGIGGWRAELFLIFCLAERTYCLLLI
jgi:DNA-3-methyladenine glycosylase II